RQPPAWFPYCYGAFLIFALFLGLALWKGDENVSFLPNEYSVLPSVFLQCQLAAVCLWIPSHMRCQLRRLPEQIERSGVGTLVEKIDALDDDLFSVSLRARIALPVVVLFVLSWDLRTGVPITGWQHDGSVLYDSTLVGYVLIAFVTGCVYLSA